jgi:hypothetical protein
MQAEEPEGDTVEATVVISPSAVTALSATGELEPPSTVQVEAKEDEDYVKTEDHGLPLNTAAANEDNEARIPFPQQTFDTPNEDPTIELPSSMSSSPVQPSTMRNSVRSRKSSSSASILSIRTRPDSMFKPGTPTTAVSAVVAKSAAGTIDSAGNTPGSPLPKTEELDSEDDYFAEHRRTSTGSAGYTPRENEQDDMQAGTGDKDALLVRPAYGTASQSLREIHKAK